MHTLIKYCLKSGLGLFLVFGSTEVIWANGSQIDSKIAKNCKTEVGTYCSSNAETCKEYCKAKNIKECDCNTKTGLCNFDVTDNSSKDTNELKELNNARYAACIEEQNIKKEWQKTNTPKWLLLTANPKEKLKPGELSVRDAVKVSEKLVHEECVEVHAPKYCEVKEIADCNAESLCKTLPKELKAQVEAQLMACIAAKRDPTARKTGRPEYTCESPATPGKKPIPWCSINSPSWREEILYPDPEKAAKKQRYMDSLADLEKQIAAAKKAKEDHKDLDTQLKNLVLEKSLGQETEEKIEADICSDTQAPASCRGDDDAASSGSSAAPAA